MTKFIKSFAAALVIVTCALVSDAVTTRIGALHPKNGIVVTEESDPTVPAWAKEPEPPVSGINAATATNIAQAAAADFAATGTVAYAAGLFTGDEYVRGSEIVNDVRDAQSDVLNLYAADAAQTAALEGKASTNDVRLTPVYSQTPTFSEWTFSGSRIDPSKNYSILQSTEPFNEDVLWTFDLREDGIGINTYDVILPEGVLYDVTLITPSMWTEKFDMDVTATRTRTDIIGYTLGSQTDKVLASTNLQSGVSASAVTNIVRDLSLGGIWDSQLNVWWTPRMRNGSLTYEATTNVNLNAGN